MAGCACAGFKPGKPAHACWPHGLQREFTVHASLPGHALPCNAEKAAFMALVQSKRCIRPITSVVSFAHFLDEPAPALDAASLHFAPGMRRHASAAARGHRQALSAPGNHRVLALSCLSLLLEANRDNSESPLPNQGCWGMAADAFCGTSTLALI